MWSIEEVAARSRVRGLRYPTCFAIRQSLSQGCPAGDAKDDIYIFFFNYAKEDGLVAVVRIFDSHGMLTLIATTNDIICTYMSILTPNFCKVVCTGRNIFMHVWQFLNALAGKSACPCLEQMRWLHRKAGSISGNRSHKLLASAHPENFPKTRSGCRKHRHGQRAFRES